MATDPNAPWVYVMVARYGSPLCRRCPDPVMMLERSRDDGRTWSKARPVCRCAGTPWQADPIVGVVPDTGSVYAIWMDTWKVVFSRSDDHGRTWSRPVSTKGTVPWNDKPALTMSDDGRDVWVTWNGPSGGDAFVARSRDGGASWSRRRVVRSDRYYFAYDGDVTSDGTVVLAQSSLSYSGPGGAPAGAVKHHALVSDDGARVAERRGRLGADRRAVPRRSLPVRLLHRPQLGRRRRRRRPVLRLRRRAPRGSTTTHVAAHVRRRRRHVVATDRGLRAARAVRVPDGDGDRLGRRAALVHADAGRRSQRVERPVHGRPRTRAPPGARR